MFLSCSYSYNLKINNNFKCCKYNTYFNILY
nr:MAG TPA: hypothetical protein [Crassvirales sp.]